MSGYSGIASAAVALVLAFVAVGQPFWEWRHDDGAVVEVWSYKLFGVDHIVENRTAGTTVTTPYTYYDVPAQPQISALFLETSRWTVLSILAGLGAAGLSVATSLRKLRGMFAGLSFLGGCAAALYTSLSFVFAIPAAAVDLGTFYGQTIPDFRGRFYEPTTGDTLTWGPLIGWFLLLAAGLAMAWGSSEVWHVRFAKARAGAPRSAAAAQPAYAPPAPAQPLVQVVQEPAPQEPTIDEVFVIAPSGLLVKHMSRSLLSDKDRDVVGGMISVVSNFVRDAFTEKDGQVQEIQLGGHRFIMYNEHNLVTAVMVGKGSTEDVLHRLKHLTAVLKDRYGERILNWDGEPLEGIEDEVAVLWEPFFVPPPPAD